MTAWRLRELEGETDVVGTSASVLSYAIRMAQRSTISETMLVVFYLVNESLGDSDNVCAH